MINVQICTGTSAKYIFDNNTSLTADEIWERVEKTAGLSKEHFYIVCNGRTVEARNKPLHGCATIFPKLLGGKGGFGSMLRAIGAQIEKTTNREACRDLSGRRLRDINEEKRLKAWIEKQSKREEEAVERKNRKLAKLCAEPKHEFKDQNYERERSVLTERIGDAVEQGFKVAIAGSSTLKRKQEEEIKNQKRKKILLDVDIDSDELDTSDDSDNDEETTSPKSDKSDQQILNDSGHSSDATEKNGNNSGECRGSNNSSKDLLVNSEGQTADAKEDKENARTEAVKEIQTNSQTTDTTEKDEVADSTNSEYYSEAKKEETVKTTVQENK